MLDEMLEFFVGDYDVEEMEDNFSKEYYKFEKGMGFN